MDERGPESEQAESRPAAPSPRGRRRRRAARAAADVLAVTLWSAAAVAVVAYAARREIAREAAVGWLEDRGVDADLRIDRLDLDGFVGTITIGDPRDPDFSVERVEVDYAVAGPGEGFRVMPRRVRLVRPLLKAGWSDKGLTLGELDPLIEEFSKRPPRPDEVGPEVSVENGRVRLTTPYGQVRLRGDARLEGERLKRLDARLQRSRLAGPDLTADLTGGAIRVRTRGDRMHVDADLTLAEWTSDALSLNGAKADLEADLPYPDAKTRRGDGAVVATLALKAEELGRDAVQTRATEANLRFEGRSQGWLESWRLAGSARAYARSGAVQAGALEARDVRLVWRSSDVAVSGGRAGLAWAAVDGSAEAGGAALRADGVFLQDATVKLASLDVADPGVGPLAADFSGGAEAARFAQGDLSLRGVAATLEGRLEAPPDGARLRLAGGLTAADGAFSGLGPAGPEDPPEVAAAKRAAAGFALSAPALRFEQAPGDWALAVDAPVTATTREGGRLVLTRRGAGPLIEDDGAVVAPLDVRIAGAGLPDAELSLPDAVLALGEGGLSVRSSVLARTSLDLGLAVDGRLETRGRLDWTGGTIAYAAADCALYTASRLELGENDVTDVSARLCPVAGQPLFRLADGAWRLNARLSEARAGATVLETAITEGAGRLTAQGGAQGLSLVARIDQAVLTDQAATVRYRPMRASGDAALDNGRWRARLNLTRDGRPIGVTTVTHDGESGRGSAVIRAERLAFVPDGLQPADLAPAVQGLIQSPASGVVDFQGRADWTAQGLTSSGTLTTDGLDFRSPAGAVKRLSGTIALTGLAPLETAPDQVVRIESVDGVVPVRNVEMRFRLTPDALEIASADLVASGGAASVEPVRVPLDPQTTWEGALVLNAVELGPLVEASSFGPSVDFDAKVSGRLPFSMGPQGVRFSGGSLRADGPGRLSIRREALAGVNAGGGVPSAEPNTVQDLAYQAMENLAYESLTAEVNSLPGGRLGVLFNVVGRHDPPQRQEARVGFMDILRNRFMDQKLPLPSGTGVNLTLDTSLNLEQLLQDLREVDRARDGLDEASPQRSQPVQPEQPRSNDDAR